MPYEAQKAVEYAHRWAYRRNPTYMDLENMGGDCTNFVSQCLFAGGAPMDYTPTFGWYYRAPEDRAAAWTGVEFLYTFLMKRSAPGLFAQETPLEGMRPGDVIQLSFAGGHYSHTLLVVQTMRPLTPRNVLIACHSMDSDNRSLATYNYQSMRCLRIGVQEG